MNAVINTYLLALRQAPVLLDIALRAALDDLDSIAADPHRMEQLNADVVFLGQAPFSKANIRHLQILLKIHRKAVMYRHLWFHRRRVHHLSRPFKTSSDGGSARAWEQQMEGVGLLCVNPDLCIVLEEVIGSMCCDELGLLHGSFERLATGEHFVLGQSITRKSLSQGMTFALGPIWHNSMPAGLGAYLGLPYSDAACAVLDEIRRMVEREHALLQHRRARLSTSTESGFVVTVPGNGWPRSAA